MHAALDSMKLSSSPGLDQISYKVIRALPENYLDVLSEIFNSILRDGSFPKQWSHSLVVLIPKPQGKGVRPISLLSCFLKLFEKILYGRLRWAMESRCVIPDFQAGFRSGRSCQDNLVSLTSFVHAAFLKREVVACVFLDIAGAFDNVIPSVLSQDLYELGLPFRL